MPKFLRFIGGGDADGRQVAVYREKHGMVRLTAETVEGNRLRALMVCQATGKRKRIYIPDKIISTEQYNDLVKRWERDHPLPSVQSVRLALEFMGYGGYSAHLSGVDDDPC
jgi:hypothetical protein